MRALKCHHQAVSQTTKRKSLSHKICCLRQYLSSVAVLWQSLKMVFSSARLSLSMVVFDLSYADRLLENLVQKEKEYQTLLRQSLEQKTQELRLLRLKLKPEGMRRYCMLRQLHTNTLDHVLV